MDTFSSSDFQVATCCIGISVIALVVHDRCWSRVGYWSDFFYGQQGVSQVISKRLNRISKGINLI